MAQHVEVVLVDDVDGSPAGETVTFALDGISYEIDLNGANAARLREGMSEWLSAARRLSGPRSQTRRPRTTGEPRAAKPATGGQDNTAIREWARANGHTVSDRGRIKAKTVQAYNAANA